MIPLFEKAHSLPLTETEKNILEYFENNLPLSIHTHLNDLSSTLYTSNATIVRFCQKLGLNGYNEFKYQLRHELKQAQKTVFSANDLIAHSLALFRDNMESIDTGKLKRIADYLTGDHPVYIYGSNLSSVPAKYLQVILNTLDYPSILIEWHRLLTGLIHEITPDSVLFMISAHGDSQRYLPIFECAKKRGIITILLTCEKDSSLLPLSTIWMCSNDQNEEYHQVDINPRLGIITLIQLIIELAAQGTIYPKENP